MPEANKIRSILKPSVIHEKQDFRQFVTIVKSPAPLHEWFHGTEFVTADDANKL